MDTFSNVTDPGLNTSENDEFITENLSVIPTLAFTSTSYTTYHEKVIFWIMGTVGFLGNSLVIFVFLGSPTLRHKITNILILHQSVIDAVASTFIALNNGFDGMGWIKEPGHLAYYFCKLWLSKYLIWAPMVVSTFNLVALTFERYLGLIYPLLYKRYFTKKGVCVTICIVWITGLAFMSFSVLTTELKGKVCSTWSEWPSQMFQNVFGVIIIVFDFIIPICIMSFCYGRITLMIHREVRMPSASQQREKLMQKARFNMIRTLLLVSICFFICFVWDSVYYLLYNLGIPVGSFTSPMYQFGVVVRFANCCVNPFIYALSFKAFQKSLKSAFFCGAKGSTGSQTISETRNSRANPSTTVVSDQVAETIAVTTIESNQI
ncbi:unnamed protein product [Owenia fusiformis]|uniref:Uncharacterized protein n=1 Tax=Owenia fusiformis TaxID=6347 RepID=A0A8J1UZ42_OWEFU|nr:unnamed protein product [Owenia fusiformis]